MANNSNLDPSGEDGEIRQRRIITADNPSYEADDEEVQLRHPNRHLVSPETPEHGVDVGDGLNLKYDESMANLLELLPSRQMESIADAAAQTLWKRIGFRGSSIHRGTIRLEKEDELEELIVQSLNNELDKDEDLIEDLDNTVRTIPTTLSRKRHIKHQLSSRRKRALSRYKLAKYWCGMMWQHLKAELRKMGQLFTLWRSHLMTIEGCFGTSVVSYFIFLKWVLLINIPIFLLTFAFLVIPQILYRNLQKDPPGYADNEETFTGIELLTGEGFFENTEMYYGAYTNETVEISKGTHYKMKYAYLTTCGGYYIFCLIILGFSYLRSYRKYYIDSSNTIGPDYFSMVFCGWDYGITSPEASQLKQRSIFNELKECLAGEREMHLIPSRDEVAKKWLLRLCTWTGVLMLLGASGFTTYVVSTRLSIQLKLDNSTNMPSISPLVMPVVLSTIQLFVPMAFTLLESHEDYSEPKYELYVHMFREMALKATMLGVLVYFWLDITSEKLKCWETFVGQEIYRLVVIDLLFTLGYSFFMEFIRKLISLKWSSVKRAEFAIGRHTLELVYSQSLCWLGIFYAPLLPVVAILKLIIIFYVKRYSVVHNCRPSLRPWRASRTHTIFVGYLFIFFILCCVAVGCSVFLIRPSKTCGPYKDYTTSYQVISDLIQRQKEAGMSEFFNIINSPGFIAGVLVFLGVILYYTRTIMITHSQMVKQFKTQLESERKDKKFLLNLLNQVKIRGQRVAICDGPTIQRAIEAISPGRATGAKVFVRTVAESMASTSGGHK